MVVVCRKVWTQITRLYYSAHSDYPIQEGTARMFRQKSAQCQGEITRSAFGNTVARFVHQRDEDYPLIP